MSNPRKFQIFTSACVIDNTNTLDVGSISSDGLIIYRGKEMNPNIYEISGNSYDDVLSKAVESLVHLVAASQSGEKEPSEHFLNELKSRLVLNLSRKS